MGDLSRGLENVPVLCEDGTEPPEFQYTSEHVVGPGAELDPTEVTFPGCSCRTLPCLEGTCQCLCYEKGYAFAAVSPESFSSCDAP
ncbi:histone-lysine N-methyltransferase SETMAR isoform X2 [Ambystoma mexicanum]|uniref:histone-lysine N-methyltransferase SETMAR isoform X2 n=1 Tax=Ambystoma mexicanum TaxID=8296 RepID=UPI0037E83B19